MDWCASKQLFIHSFSCIKNKVDTSLFIDDFRVSYGTKHILTVERQLQLYLNIIQEWADNNGINFYQLKTVHISVRGGGLIQILIRIYRIPIHLMKEYFAVLTVLFHTLIKEWGFYVAFNNLGHIVTR